MRTIRKPGAWAKIGAVALSVALLIGLGSALSSGQSASRNNLVQRFQLRGLVASRFLASYTSGILNQEQNEALRWLASPTVSTQNFEELTANFGFQAAVLLDSSGHVVEVYPPKPSLLGQIITGKYAHLRMAIQGRSVVSNVVPSAAKGIPVAAFAVPFEASSGRRVYSGALSVASSTLGVYLHSLNSVPSTKVFLQDGNGLTIASNVGVPQTPDLLRRSEPHLYSALLGQRDGTFRVHGQTQVFASERISGTSWTLVLAVPQSVLFAPISGVGVWVSWLSFGGLVALSLTVLFVLVRLARVRAEQVRYKDELISHVSHELRTPLTAIHQFTSIVLDGLAGELQPDQRRYLRIVLRNTEHLSRMVKDLVDSARALRGRLSINPSAVDVGESITTALADFEERATEAGVTVESVIPPDLSPVWTDPVRLRQVLTNLVDNAIKFTPPGGEVRVEAGIEPASALMWIAVADTGVGLPQAEKDRVFERLYQTDAGVENRSGLGLGLHICKELIERQGGTIRTDEGREQGSRFVFTLPLVTSIGYDSASAQNGARIGV